MRSPINFREPQPQRLVYFMMDLSNQALKLSSTGLGDTAPGKIVNLVANDVNKFEEVSYYLNHVWTAPSSAFIIAFILYKEIGWPGVIGMIIVLTVAPIQSKCAFKKKHRP